MTTQTLNLPAIAARISEVTGHRVGTPVHEATLVRVLVELSTHGLSAIRDDGRSVTVMLTRAEFLGGES
jgi:hypothetical protein